MKPHNFPGDNWQQLIFVILETFHKYDGFIYPEPSTWSWAWDKLDKWFSSGSALDDRRAFFREFFPKWSGFHVGSCDPKIQPVEALEQVECLVEDISAVWTVATTYTTRNARRRTVNYDKLKLSEVGVYNQELVNPCYRKWYRFGDQIAFVSFRTK